MRGRKTWLWFAGLTLVVMATALVPAWAAGKANGGGNVLPATAECLGYSLAEGAAATAVFNEGPRTEDLLPDLPFQILYWKGGVPEGEETIHQSTTGMKFYVPVFYSDDRDGEIPGWVWPDIDDPADVADYWYNPDRLGLHDVYVKVDGKLTSLDGGWTAAAAVSGLPDPATEYSCIAVFLTPLTKGTHTVEIGAVYDGEYLKMYGWEGSFSITYTVTVD